MGTIAAIDSNNSELSVLFPTSEAGATGSPVVIYGWGELDHLVPAYACTIHKSQGSEYPAVVILLLTQHYAMLQATWFTRGSPAASSCWCWCWCWWGIGKRGPWP